MDASKTLEGLSIVPVVVIEDISHAVNLANVLYEAGFLAIEVTLRTSCALRAIEEIVKNVPEIIVGAGSVRTVEQLSKVENLGVHFAVSPGSTQRLIAEAKRIEIPFVPGAATSSEMLDLYESGYKLQKFFPAEQLGGIAMLRALSAPLPDIEFFATGGLTTALAKEYLKLVNVNCVGGSWFIPNNLLQEKCFDKIGVLAAAALNHVS
tara:strand:- start:375 stop:998 length:624 start_codon:yes stop_codon:yes gene_type:complete